MKLNFVDLFSGAGGLSCGLMEAGMNCLLGVDHDHHAIETFAQNHKNAHTYCGDIKKLDKKKLKELIGDNTVHAVVGGPPCQGFSTVGLGNPDDKRNQLFLEFVRIVKELKPCFVVIENVTGLLAKKNEDTLLSIFEQFHKLGFVMDARVLSAEKYGVPEKRRRTVIIGTKINSIPLFPEITHTKPATVGDAFIELQKDKKLLNHDVKAASLSSKIEEERIKRVPEGQGIRYQKDEEQYLPQKLRLNVNWDELREGRFRQTKYQRLDRNKPGPTILTHRHMYFHPTEHRYLTVREAAKIQSFPNDFEFKGPITSQWRQIGNAVPPMLGKAIGEGLLKMYKTPEKLSTKVSMKKDKIAALRTKAFQYKEKNKG